MKTGIITYHRALNYGAVLQAVALRVVLEEMGHEAFYFDYWPRYHKSKYSLFSWQEFLHYSGKDKAYYCYRSLIMAPPRLHRKRSFSSFFHKYITPYCIKINTQGIDIALYGSDQIWRKQHETNCYNPIYFGDNQIRARKKISYAASMGILPTQPEDNITLQALLKNFNDISVREKDLSEFLNVIGFSKHEIVIDPTLLLSAEKWKELVKIPTITHKKYVLVYGITKHFFDEKRIEQFAKEKGLTVIYLSGTAAFDKRENRYSTQGPEYFLALISNAEYVFSSSFHGIAFSIVFQKDFFAAFGSNSNRAYTLLEALGISDRLITDNNFNLPKINYNRVSEKLSTLRQRSLSFLHQSINTL